VIFVQKYQVPGMGVRSVPPYVNEEEQSCNAATLCMAEWPEV
jgi:hypothetical protein